ncbi:DmsE family decaheme c-type cytochrome [Permianibacter aggregans]|uniref:DmsE family decaheme c-type cytochrome n=1 Tax=Permianibacter aggregans TaxID=1510150 RepID=A0A4R6UGQ5_9GAMM|nr:DmsE family decaheme c-type cytochrome [Permianibacter aggregans]QGX38212.1 DmsE family decaheme c-type cytochrome [Permianibacter aggregans]TDQ44125.1 DmsE family decaheme c-type cytochrome [Permianibacter aggregans]
MKTSSATPLPKSIFGWRYAFSLCLIVVTGLLMATPALASSQRCMICHDAEQQPAIAAMLHSRHGIGTGAERASCTDCHGESTAHMTAVTPGAARAPTDVSFTHRLPAASEARNAPCLGCHEGATRMHWRGSRHDFANVACHDCHQLHTDKDRVLDKRGETAVCLSCHNQQRAEFLRPYNHMSAGADATCTDCHAAHGSMTPASLVAATRNDTCFQCHAEKRGPFLWEHPPVREECTLCHQPHGSVHPAMLTQRSPWLCQQCHLAQFHPSTALSGTGLPGATPGSSSMLGKDCMNCHTQVHGSNHPSGIRQTR